MIRRRVTRLLLLFVVTVLGWANTHTTAVSVPRASVASYTYDSPIPNGPTGYAATERVPPMQLVTSIAPAGQVVVGHGSDGTSAGQKIGASVVTCNYDCAPQFVQVVHGDNTGAQMVGASIGNLPTLQQTSVAAKSGLRAPQVVRVGDGKLSAVPKGAVGTPSQTGKGLEYVIPRGTSEISEKVASVRIMDPITSGKYQYPKGYAMYMNGSGQSINPLTGQTIANSSPFAHIPLP